VSGANDTKKDKHLKLEKNHPMSFAGESQNQSVHQVIIAAFGQSNKKGKCWNGNNSH